MSQTWQDREPIPLTIVGGFLGAGKTTLINRLLSAGHGRRLTVIVNDFGDINIDASLILHRDEQVIALSNGCVCCSLGSSLSATLMEVRSAPEPPDHVVIEASGVADPAKIAQIGLAGTAFRLSALVVMADALDVRRHAGDRYVGRMVVRQFARADLVVLNKCDLVDDARRQEVKAWLSSASAGAAILETTNAHVAPELVLEPGLERNPADPIEAAGRDDEPHAISRWSFSLDATFRRAAFERFIEEIPPGVLRSKGFVAFHGESGTHVFQSVGRRWTLEPADHPARAIRLVFLGHPDSATDCDLHNAINRLREGALVCRGTRPPGARAGP